MGIFDTIKRKTSSAGQRIGTSASSAGRGFQEKMAEREANWKQQREARQQAKWRGEYRERFSPSQLPESERKPSFRESMSERYNPFSTQHRTQRAYDKWNYNQTYKEEKQRAQSQKMRMQARNKAYHEVFRKPLGETLSIYGTAARHTYNKARSSGVLDALISGNTGHYRGRFDARRSVSPVAFYGNKENIFGASPFTRRRTRKRTLRRSRPRSSYAWDGLHVSPNQITGGSERTIKMGATHGKARFRAPRRSSSSRAMTGLELMHLRNLPTKMGMAKGDFDVQAYTDSSLTYGENKANIAAQISREGGRSDEYVEPTSYGAMPQERESMEDWVSRLEWQASQGDEDAQRVIEDMKRKGSG